MLFRDKYHLDFYEENIIRTRTERDPYRQALFYTLGLTDETWEHVNDIYDFQEDKGMKTGYCRISCIKLFPRYGSANYMDYIEAMRSIDVRTVNPDTLVDLNEVTIDTSLSKEERLIQFVRQIKNPYCYRVWDTVVKVSFSDTDATLEKKLENYICSL